MGASPSNEIAEQDGSPYHLFGSPDSRTRPGCDVVATWARVGDEKNKAELQALIDRGYDELCEELERAETAELVVPEDLRDAPETDARTVVIDAQGAAMDYAIASSLFPHVRIEVPPEGAERPSEVSGLRVVKGRISEPPPLGGASPPMRIVKGSKLRE